MYLIALFILLGFVGLLVAFVFLTLGAILKRQSTYFLDEQLKYVACVPRS